MKLKIYEYEGKLYVRSDCWLSPLFDGGEPIVMDVLFDRSRLKEVGELEPVGAQPGDLPGWVTPYQYNGKPFVMELGFPLRPAKPGERVIVRGTLWVAGGNGWERGDQEEVEIMYRVLHHPDAEVVGGEKVGIDKWGNRVERDFGNPYLPEGKPIANGRVILADDGYYYYSVGGDNGHTIFRVKKGEIKCQHLARISF